MELIVFCIQYERDVQLSLWGLQESVSKGQEDRKSFSHRQHWSLFCNHTDRPLVAILKKQNKNVAAIFFIFSIVRGPQWCSCKRSWLKSVGHLTHLKRHVTFKSSLDLKPKSNQIVLLQGCLVTFQHCFLTSEKQSIWKQNLVVFKPFKLYI